MADALEIWRRRLEEAEKELATVSDFDAKFTLTMRIADAQAQIVRLEARARAGTAPTASSFAVPVGAPEVCYSLVIGVDDYTNGAPNGTGFPDLHHARADAQRFHDFVTAAYPSSPGDAILLRDGEGSRTGILRALDDLRARCTRGPQNPLVLVYFAGHGARDNALEQYLVPSDGRWGDLFATGIWNDHFQAALARVGTNRLVLFLDACHSGGPSPSTRAGNWWRPGELVTPDAGRYVVTSCGEQQYSLEDNGGGVFTRELLRLLTFEADEVSDLDTLELYELGSQLQATVDQRTGGQQRQVPWLSFDAPTDVVISVHQDRREFRVNRETVVFDALTDQHFPQRFDFSSPVRARLRKGIPQGRMGDRDAVYKLFRQSCGGVDPAAGVSDDFLLELCRDLADEFVAEQRKKGVSGGSAPSHPRSAGFGSRPGVAAQPREQQGSKSEGAQSRMSPASAPRPAPAPASDGGRLHAATGGAPVVRRDLREDCDHIVEPIPPMRFQEGRGKLRGLLLDARGVSEEDFDAWHRDVKPANEADAKVWEKVAAEVIERFLACWQRQAANPISVRTGNIHG